MVANSDRFALAARGHQGLFALKPRMSALDRYLPANYVIDGIRSRHKHPADSCAACFGSMPQPVISYPYLLRLFLCFKAGNAVSPFVF